MRMKQATTAILLLAGTLVALTGCGAASKRSPEDWLSMSYSALAATDQYEFTGSMSIKTADGMEYKPEIFEGKVVDHEQLTVQTSNDEALQWNPVDVLEALNKNHAEVILRNDTKDPKTVVLHITEDHAVSKARWEQRLRQQLDQLESSAPLEESAYKTEWVKEMSRSKKQLNNMLASLEAATEYDLVIDRIKLLPIKMEEKTKFNYTHRGHPVSESRYTSVRFQSYDGSPSVTFQ
ncbi:hypothetical protein FHS15_000850 [Paenibacillus castaneae]|uniref:hypothetical protein n=1 Tax=Paenibacillus castaneae TaxID=474957 RepID=UPI000C9A197C|nr:hypothetical protein [Paenibacillus castaneae]NIK75750.1 hypothetical protein [Paenibacillus castaneae]